MVAQVGYSMAGRLRGQVVLCVVCTVHVETMRVGFLVEPQNQGRRFVTIFSGLTLKLVVTVFSGLTSKSVARISQLGPQNRQLRFDDLCLKITVTVSWFRPQNQAGFGLSVAP
jgi:hypothetical protein